MCLFPPSPHQESNSQQFMRYNLYKAVTDHSYLMGGKTPFDFKFIPSVDRKFGKEVDLAETPPAKTKLARPLENVFFAVFLMAGFLIFAVAWGVCWMIGPFLKAFVGGLDVSWTHETFGVALAMSKRLGDLRT